ncbi:hypothetical protein K438DRAFT_1811627, partial [Mycena galopus ATCC 62051]
MAMVPVLHLILELLAVFCASFLVVLTLLRGASVRFLVLGTLEITFICTLVVLTVMRTAGYFGRGPKNQEGKPPQCDGGQMAPVKSKEKDVADLV